MMTSLSNGFTSSNSKPLFSFGVIADVQYADIPDGKSFLGTPRFYRHSISVLQRAVKSWNDKKNVNFSINFGDILDGFCPKTERSTAIEKILNEFEKFNGDVYHMIGNHCLYNFPRSKLLPLLKIPSENLCAYYDFTPCPEYRFIVLDAYDFSVLGWPKDHEITKQAIQFLEERNPNSNKDSPDGLVGVERRFVKFNGGVGKEQLSWLEGILRDCSERKQNAIVCCHLPLDPGAASPVGLLWNYDEVMEVIHKYNCVKACFSGHDHKGGYTTDSRGIHHRCLEAALECPPGSNAYGFVDVYQDRLSLVGTDRMACTEMII
ncbi:hypothetical protein LUZ60_015682 [Juncus effusus]|nr:hypothetical protein LUZ60_015682 [Juncus effusus]